MPLLEKKNKASGLKIIIVGCGKVGTTLVSRLVKEGHDITVIDTSAGKVQEVSSLYDVLGIVGNGATYSTQMEAGIEEADLFIAVTSSDELNLLCCTVAKRVGDCAVIARVRTPDYSAEIVYLREKLGLAMVINPEWMAAQEIAHILYLPAALGVNAFAHGMAQLINFKIPEKSPLAGKSLIQLSKHMDLSNVVICAVERDKEVHIPGGNFVLQAGDEVSFVSTRQSARHFLMDVGLPVRQVTNCLIVGGGKSAYYLSKLLIDMGINVRIIERKKERAEELSVLLPKAIVINGDGTDEELLKQENIDTVESFVPLTGIDEENVILTLYAREVSHAKLVTKINRITFTDVLEKLDLGSLVYPKYIAAEAILTYVRGKKNSIGSNVETLYHLFDDRAEAIEFVVSAESKVTNTPLMELPLKKNLLVACILRGGESIIPSGQDEIHVGDGVIIVTTETGLNDITDVLT